MVDQTVSIIPVEDYILRIDEQNMVNGVTIGTSVGIYAPTIEDKRSPSGGRVYVSKTYDVATAMMAKGSTIGQDAVYKANTFDEKHQLTTTASAKGVGISEKIAVGIFVTNEKVKSVDQKLHVSDETMASPAVAARPSKIMHFNWTMLMQVWF